MSNYYLNLSETYIDQNYNDFEYPKGTGYSLCQKILFDLLRSSSSI